MDSQKLDLQEKRPLTDEEARQVTGGAGTDIVPIREQRRADDLADR